jgi:hypothetical protein
MILKRAIIQQRLAGVLRLPSLLGSFVSTQALSLTVAAGLALTAAGCAMVFPPLGLIVPGVVLTALPIFGLMQRGAR